MLRKQTDVLKGVIATSTEHKVRGIKRDALKLPLHIANDRTVNRPQAGLPPIRQDVSELGHNVRFARNISPVIEDEIAKQDYVVTFSHTVYIVIVLMAVSWTQATGGGESLIRA